MFQFRWLLWTAGAFLALVWVLCLLGNRQTKSKVAQYQEAFAVLAERHFGTGLWVLGVAFCLLGSVQKASQFFSLSLNGQDFWLFEDMLNQMRAGAPFLTRFAPQSLGWVQHGAIHPFWSFYLLVPLSWLFGALGACLLFMPLVLSVSGILVGLLARPFWGAGGAWILSFAFLASTQVGKILGYDVHPEALYPLAVLLWAWGVGLHTGKARHWAWVLAVVVGLGIREDSFAVFLPVFAWGVFRKPIRRLSVISLLIGVVLTGFQFLTVQKYSTGAWGPGVWNGEPVIVPGALPFLGGQPLDLTASPLALMRQVLGAAGGMGAILKRWALFWVSRPWFSLVIFAPWLLASVRLWVWLLPVGSLFALVGGWPATLIHHYSAPFLGGFWLAAATGTASRQRGMWILFAVLVFGNSGIEIQWPSPGIVRIQNEAALLVRCIRSGSGKGIVGPALTGLITERSLRDRVFADRLPAPDHPVWNKMDFVLVTPGLPRWEMGESQIHALMTKLSANPAWELVGPDCQPLRSQDTLSRRAVVLFQKRDR